MTRWQYNVLWVRNSVDWQEGYVATQLNLLGEQGWEVVSASGPSGQYVLLKRPDPNQRA